MKRLSDPSEEINAPEKRAKAETDSSVASPLSLVFPPLRELLHAHQREAVCFLLRRLLPERLCDAPVSELSDTGAILADDMGTGKTLVGLVTAATVCRVLNCKAVIVSPSTLTGNWEREMKKWMPATFGRTGIVVPAGKSTSTQDLAVNKFITSKPSVHPVLVVSYEMFRAYAEALNTLSNFELLLCDEGHRLKNALGTKTSLALSHAVANRRLVLTGTPIQNNLQELYAVVQFAVPHYLGTLQEFQREFAAKIEKGRERNASASEKEEAKRAENALREKLASLMLRRTKDWVMKSLLPPKLEYVLTVRETESNRERYERETQCILDKISTSPSSSSGKEKDGEWKNILPELLSLRLLCSNGATADRKEDEGAEATEIAENLSNESVSDAICAKQKLCEELISSIREAHPEDKIVVVSNFSLSLDRVRAFAKSRRWGSLRIDGSVPNEKRMKIVEFFNKPVSLFDDKGSGSATTNARTSVSNDAQRATTDEHWRRLSKDELLRRNTFCLLLLSARSGGVGLNLVGANHLILLDPDWNPATDQQAMGRIFREGQTKQCFIYRLIVQESVEEAILGRQFFKSSLSSIVSENIDGSAPVLSAEEEEELREREREDEERFRRIAAGSRGVDSLLRCRVIDDGLLPLKRLGDEEVDLCTRSLLRSTEDKAWNVRVYAPSD